MVDLHAVIQGADEGWFTGVRRGTGNGARVLVAEGSGFSRALMRGRLEMAGHRVIEASNIHDALEILAREKIDAVATALDLPGGGGAALLAGMRSQPELSGVPAIALTANPAEMNGGSGKKPEFDRYEMKFAYGEMLRDIEELIAPGQAAGENSEVPVRM